MRNLKRLVISGIVVFVLGIASMVWFSGTADAAGRHRQLRMEMGGGMHGPSPASADCDCHTVCTWGCIQKNGDTCVKEGNICSTKCTPPGCGSR